MFFYVKALHIIFIVTWFSGLFYIVRLFIYNAEAETKPFTERQILRDQFNIMIKRLWYGITWPSAILTLIFGGWLWYLYGILPDWLMLKLLFVVGLYGYHISLHVLFKQQMRGEFKYNGQQLRFYNEVATIFLVAIVMLVVVKNTLSLTWGLLGLFAFIALLLAAINIYKKFRG